MTEQFENPEETKVAEETVSDSPAKQKIEHVAEKAAAQPAKTVKKYDSEHQIFTI
jgi:hypothetical protein